MKIIKIIAAAAGLTVLSLASVAQEEEEGPLAFTYATYFYCGGGPLSRADEIIADDAERMNGLVEDGTISRWGWLAHHTGGQWQRIFYFQADTMEALLDAGGAVQGGGDDEEEAEDKDDGVPFNQICPRHDDYIWSVENGTAGKERGAAGFSVYHVCDLNREERADEIVDAHFAPILNKMVEDGKLTSWGWSSHVVGGKYRKLQTMTAADMSSLLKARGEVIEVAYAEDSEAGEEFTDICGPHSDYMWDIQLESE
ncbi:MAG: hypothetical protein OEU90_04855 [Gammaproteobacteria bacterium]|nr:hypothetical protein [Gammaproteobacteria bacterium]MDH3751068.1 hypothetical protein [Gammaproteobacteria bacterium]MDH3804789.1 hypothetical protein [Gammaproteobacteria bacterium]